MDCDTTLPVSLLEGGQSGVMSTRLGTEKRGGLEKWMWLFQNGLDDGPMKACVELRRRLSLVNGLGRKSTMRHRPRQTSSTTLFCLCIALGWSPKMLRIFVGG